MKKLKIVFVENDEDEQLFIKEGFEATDMYEVLGQFSSGSELFSYMDNKLSRWPDVILSDLNMPGKNGHDILTEIKEKPYARVPVVITSTSSTRSIIEKCLSMGAADYMIKPETFIEYEPFARNLYKRVIEKNLV
ncbi:MAG: response regulator [Flavisolibacter sp.]|jgi:DNA-binding NarL/FixJ family response regulator